MDTSSVPGTLSVTISTDGVYSSVISADTGNVAGDWSCRKAPVPASGSESKAGPPAMNLLDGRLNDVQDKDVAAPVALYNTPLSIFSIDPETGNGWLTFSISDEAIEAAGIPVDAPVLLAQGTNPHTGMDIFVYRLPTGEFQINTHYADGTPYVFVWDNNGSSYHLPQ